MGAVLWLLSCKCDVCSFFVATSFDAVWYFDTRYVSGCGGFKYCIPRVHKLLKSVMELKVVLASQEFAKHHLSVSKNRHVTLHTSLATQSRYAVGSFSNLFVRGHSQTIFQTA